MEMDNLKVPKKVNRHVLKALNILCSGNFKECLTTARICYQVKYQMRNLVPVSDVDYVIKKSLKNLSEVGLIQRQGRSRFCLGRNYAPPPATNLNHTETESRIFKIDNNRQDNRSTLDRNLKRYSNSDDSFSVDCFDETRKRMRSNIKQQRNSGRSTILTTRARQHKCSMKVFEMHPNFVDASKNVNSNIEHVVGIIKNSSNEFMEQNVPPVASLEITETTDEVKEMNEVKEMVEEPDEVMVDAQVPKLKVQQNSVAVQQHSSSTNIGENPSTQKVEKDVEPSSSLAIEHFNYL